MSWRPSLSRSTIWTFAICGRSLPRIGSPTGCLTKKSDAGPLGNIPLRSAATVLVDSRGGAGPQAEIRTGSRHASARGSIRSDIVALDAVPRGMRISTRLNRLALDAQAIIKGGDRG